MEGLGDAPDPAYRTTIVPILGAGQSVRGDILAMWGRATARDARDSLGSDTTFFPPASVTTWKRLQMTGGGRPP